MLLYVQTIQNISYYTHRQNIIFTDVDGQLHSRSPHDVFVIEDNYEDIEVGEEVLAVDMDDCSEPNIYFMAKVNKIELGTNKITITFSGDNKPNHLSLYSESTVFGKIPNVVKIQCYKDKYISNASEKVSLSTSTSPSSAMESTTSSDSQVESPSNYSSSEYASSVSSQYTLILSGLSYFKAKSSAASTEIATPTTKYIHTYDLNVSYAK